MKAFCLEMSNSKNLILAFKNDDSEYFVELKTQIYKSEIVWDLIKEGFERINLAPSDLDFIGTGLGPGSFTGLRVGLSIVKGIALSLNIPVVGVSSFDLLAKSVFFNGKLCIIFDAKKGLFYTAIYARDFKLRKVLKESLKTLDDLKKILEPGIFILGDGIKLLDKKFIKRFKVLEEDFSYVNPRVLLNECINRFKKKRFLKLERLKPLYLHPLECQAAKAF